MLSIDFPIPFSNKKSKEKEEEKEEISSTDEINSSISSNFSCNEQQQQQPQEKEQSNKEDEIKEEEEEEEEYNNKFSSRFKGYLTLTLTAAVNYKEAYASIYRLPDILATTTLIEDQRPTVENRNTALIFSIGSIIITTLIVLSHFVFVIKPKVELLILLFLFLWWAVGLGLETKWDGIAGDGKNQYNVYFSVWLCFIISAWTLERWMVSCDYLSIAKSLATWPFRAPGWIAIFFFSFLSLLSVLDLFWGKYGNSLLNILDDNNRRSMEEISSINGSKIEAVTTTSFDHNLVDDVDDNTDDNPNSHQWGLLFYTITITLLPAIFFVVIELFRPGDTEKRKHKQKTWETIMEGTVLFVMMISWIPTVIVATTPGGVASDVGNCYFFLWFTAVFVMDTSIWWIHDWRKRSLLILYREQLKYQTIQQRVYEQSRQQLDLPPIPELVVGEM